MTEPGNVRERMEALLATVRARTASGDLDEQRKEADARLADITARMAEISGQTYVGSAGPDGDDERVIAEIDGNGKLLRMEISPYAMRDFDARELSVACTEALAAARSRLAAELALRLPAVASSAAGQAAPEPPDLPDLPDVDEIMRHAKELSWRR